MIIIVHADPQATLIIVPKDKEEVNPVNQATIIKMIWI